MDHRIERERLIFFCRVEEQSAPETRASAFPRRGGGAAVPSLKARRRRSPSGRVSPHRDERDNLAAPKSSGAAVPSYEGGGGGQPTDPKAGGRSGADGPRSEGGKRILLDNSRVYVRFLPFVSGRVHLTQISSH